MSAMGTVVGLSDFQVRVFAVEDVHGPPAVKVVADGACGDQSQPILFAYVLEFYSVHNFPN